MNCTEFVALTTDYLDGALDPDATRRFAAHTDECPGCAIYCDQLRATISLLGQAFPASSSAVSCQDSRRMENLLTSD